MVSYAAGDVRAFETLYGRHELAVWRFVLRSVRSADIADDLLQDVWFAVARSAARYQASAKFRTWLFTMARNRVVDHFRTRHSAVSLEEGERENSDQGEPPLLERLAADSGFGPVARLQSREQAQALVAAVEALAQEQREAFLLQAEAGLSVQEIAKATGVGVETAKSRLRYARRTLRELLKEFA